MTTETTADAFELQHKATAKRDFMLAYALARASANRGGLEGFNAVKEAKAAWDELEKLAPEPKPITVLGYYQDGPRDTYAGFRHWRNWGKQL